MTFAQAAELVLREAKRPMTTAEITDAVIARGLLKTRGRTPAATMAAALYGLPEGSAVRREFVPGVRRAKRGSVRWVYAPARRP